MTTANTKTPYQTYLADPGMRGRIDREVVRLRAEAVRKFLVTPLAECVRRIATFAHASRAAINH